MVRTFNGSTDAFSVSYLTGAPTVLAEQCWAMVVRPSAIAQKDIMTSSDSTSSNGYCGLKINTAGTIGMYDSVGGQANSTTVLAAANEWYLIVAGKAAGTATGRVSIFRWSTGVWTHENGTSVADTTVTNHYWRIGQWGNTGAGNYGGEIAAAMFVPRNLSDGERERLTAGRWAHKHAGEPGSFVVEFPSGNRDVLAVNHPLDHGRLRGRVSSVTGTSLYAGAGPAGFAFSAHSRRR